MPSLSIHLLAGRELRPNGSQLFFTGCIAPDAVSPWQKQEHAHLRDRADRNGALREFADSLPDGDDYANGALFHLFCDYIWDNSALRGYKESFCGDDWFHPYRSEIHKASSYIFNHDPGIAKIWAEVNACQKEAFEHSAYVADADVKAFISERYIWKLENDLGPSEVFTPEYVREFAKYAAYAFKMWQKDKNFSIFFRRA